MDDTSRAQRWQDNAAAQRARFADYTLDPEHTIELQPHTGSARILWNGQVIAKGISEELIKDELVKKVYLGNMYS